MRKAILLLGFAGAYHVDALAKSLDSVEIYQRMRPAVSVLEELDATEKPLQALTAIAIAIDRVATVCDALTGNHPLRIVEKGKSFPASILAKDSQRQLCLLAVPGANLTPITILDISPSIQSGARVYALSNALSLGIGISEGVISGIRPQLGTDYIQFSAPVSPGSDGGALVDAEGHLLGIITYRHRDGQNVNFAIPAKWLSEIEQQDKSDLAFKQFQETALSLQNQNKWPELAKHAQQWLQGHGNEIEAWRWAAVAADKTGELDKEETAWTKLKELETTPVAAVTGLVKLKFKRKQGQEGIQLARSLLALRQEDADIWTLVGQAEQIAGTAAKAEEAYRKALTFNPWQLSAYQGLIDIAELRNDRAMVTQLWQSLSALNPDAPTIQFKLAEAYIREGRPARAYSLLDKLTPPETLLADLFFWKGLTLNALGRPLDAINALEKSLQNNLTNKVWAYSALGNCYFQLQRFPESIQAYQEAVRLEPDNPEWQYGLALSLKDGFRGREALEIDTQLLKRFPNEATVWRQKGFTESILGLYQDGIKSMEKSLELEPRQGKVWAGLIEAYRMAGRDKDIENAFQKLRGIDSEWAEKTYRAVILPFEEYHR